MIAYSRYLSESVRSCERRGPQKEDTVLMTTVKTRETWTATRGGLAGSGMGVSDCRVQDHKVLVTASSCSSEPCSCSSETPRPQTKSTDHLERSRSCHAEARQFFAAGSPFAGDLKNMQPIRLCSCDLPRLLKWQTHLLPMTILSSFHPYLLHSNKRIFLTQSHASSIGCGRCIQLYKTWECCWAS